MLSSLPVQETQALEKEALQLSRQLAEAKKRNAELAAGAQPSRKLSVSILRLHFLLIEMRSLGKVATTEQLLATAAKLNAESEQMEAKLATFRDGTAVVLSPEAREQAELLAIAFFDAWASRRKGFKALWSSVLEAAEMSSKELKDVVAFDDDEGAGANFEEAKKLVDSIKAARFKRKGAKPA